jgi:hypothetical protein
MRDFCYFFTLVNKKTVMNKIRPAILQVILAVFIFLVLSVSYMLPALEGKSLHQGDIVQYKGSAKEIADFKEKTGETTLWTNSMFSGMPAYLIAVEFKSNLTKIFHYIITGRINDQTQLFRPWCFILLYLLGFYIALLAFGVNRLLSMVGAIAYAFSSYFIVILIAGHNAKAFALGYMPPIIAGVYLAFRGKYLLGSVLMGLFLSLQIFIIHFQITYYTFLIILIFGIVELISVIKEKRYKQFAIAMGCLLVAAMLAVASNFSSIWTTQEYGKYSIRGKSDLSMNAEVKTSGLDKDYATGWSYGVGETFTLLIPNFKGGASIGPIPEKSKTFQLLKQIQGDKQARKSIRQMYTYWGDQPSTAGPVYAGAIVIFLFVMGLFLMRGKIKWWLVAVTVLAIMLSWGKNFFWLTSLFLDYFPAYNKFRSVSMTLIMAEFALPLFGILTVNEILKGSYSKEKIFKTVLYSLYITGGICIVFILFAGSFFDFSSAIDQQYLEHGAKEFVSALRSDRMMLLRRDAFRSLCFIVLASGLFYLYTRDKLNQTYFLAGLGLLILIDMWPVNKRFVNNDDFVSKREYKNSIPKTKADEFILDHGKNDTDYRVLNVAVSTFNDATTSYYHKSLGGYHGAKMRRYQELTELQLIPEIQDIFGALQTGQIMKVDSVLSLSGSLNMLNTRYIIYNPEAMPLVNNHTYGNAWFVSDIKMAKTADEEVHLLETLDLRNQVVIHEEFSKELSQFVAKKDTSASIMLTSYAPNKLAYRSSSRKDQIAVFSEIYYPKGWNVTIDGKETGHFRADFLLRSMIVPAGNHEIIFSFRPDSYYTGNKIAYAGSGILLLLLIGILYLEIKDKYFRKE